MKKFSSLTQNAFLAGVLVFVLVIVINHQQVFAQTDNASAHADASGGIGGMNGSAASSGGSGSANGGGTANNNGGSSGGGAAPTSNTAAHMDSSGGIGGMVGSQNERNGVGSSNNGGSPSGGGNANGGSQKNNPSVVGGVPATNPTPSATSQYNQVIQSFKNSLQTVYGFNSDTYNAAMRQLDKIFSNQGKDLGGDTNTQNVPGLTPAEQQQYLKDLGVATPRTAAQQYALDKLVAACQAGCESVPAGMTYNPTYRADGYRNIIYARVGIVSALNAANTNLQNTNREKLMVTAGAGDVSVLHTGISQIDNNAGGVDVVAIASDGTGALSVSQIKAAEAAMTAAGLAYRLEAPIGDPTAEKLRAAGIQVSEYANVTGIHFSTGISADSLAKNTQYAQNSGDENSRIPFGIAGNVPENPNASGYAYTPTYSTTVAGAQPASSDPLRTLSDANKTIINDQQTISDLQKIYAFGDGTGTKPPTPQVQAEVAALNKEIAMAQNQTKTLTTPNATTGTSNSGLKTNVSFAQGGSAGTPQSSQGQPVSLGGGLTAVSQGNMTIEGGTSVRVDNVYSNYGTTNQKLVEIRETPVTQTASNSGNQNGKNKNKSSSGLVYLSNFADFLSGLSLLFTRF